MAPTIVRLLENFEVGEGPHWDIQTQSLYFVDLTQKNINKYIPATQSHTKAYFESYTTFIIPVEGTQDKFVIGLGSTIGLVKWDGQSEKVDEMKLLANLGECPQENMGYIVNDAKCDGNGRVWTGTIAVADTDEQVIPNMGSVYSFAKGELKKHFDGVSISNGITWNKDQTKFFFVDSMKNTVDQFDFDLSSGQISNRSVLFSLEKHKIEGSLDGITLDEDDNLWVAVFNGYRVIKISSQVPETLLDSVKLPAKQVTSMAWGGSNLDELYVTTGRITEDGIVLTPPDHGALYKISGLGTRGIPMSKFKL